MLENNFKFTNNCICNLPFVFIARPNDPGNGNIRVVMLEISEKEEQQLDSGKSLLLTRGGLSFNIDPELCLGYGKLDLSPNSDDVININNGNWDSRLYIRHFIPSEYDYNTHTVTSNTKNGKWYDTSMPITYIPYLYACINKPERVCIFKEYIDIIALRRAKRKAEKQKEWNKNNKENIDKKRQKRAENKRNIKLSTLIFNLN